MKDILFVFFNKYKYHFLVWSIYIAYQTLIVANALGKFYPVKQYIVINFFYILLFYFHAHVLLKYTLNSSRKFLKYSLVILTVIEITCYIIVGAVATKYLQIYAGPPQSMDQLVTKPYILGRIWMAVYYIGTSTGYYFLIHNRQQKQLVEKMKQQELKTILLEKEIKNELVMTQNAFLRAQINPHFLINTLSFLYNETRKLAPKAAESILSLSDIIQYALSKEVDPGFVELEKEIRLVENFLSLYQAREPLKRQLKLSYNEEALAVPFIPMILMSLTESIIKYGQLDDALRPAKIRITYADSVLSIETSNISSIKSPDTGHTKVLENISSRLIAIYGEKAVFSIHLDTQSYFHTYTKVQL
ncbi:sensor histidine kinase [Pedobacter cryoconitis]|uniref:Histidine kinase n=1 Tax=Pedobacter cryoconitis TaxID=188932 RepID=A0A327T0V7_9SPHI|nr:sensor histidine kinase [Pedobacter cryoconitis]RAJ34412.1 histidine kinase [Pedobacter cryoconitis]